MCRGQCRADDYSRGNNRTKKKLESSSNRPLCLRFPSFLLSSYLVWLNGRRATTKIGKLAFFDNFTNQKVASMMTIVGMAKKNARG
jgi:hypothetical protein